MARSLEGTFVKYSDSRDRVRFGDKGQSGLSTDDIANDSEVVSSTCTGALNNLNIGLHNLGTDDIANDSGVAGATCSDALDAIYAEVQALDTDDIANTSGVPGATCSDALDALAANPPTKEVFAQSQANATLGYLLTRSIAATASYRFNFQVPHDFSSVLALELIVSPDAGAAGAGKDIDLNSNYGKIGEQYDFHSESDSTSTYDLGTALEWTTIDISGVFSQLSAGDFCGLLVQHNAIGGIAYYLGIRLRYS